MKRTKESQRQANAFTANLPASPPGSRNGWWIEDCPVHGKGQPFGTVCGGCFKCAQDRINSTGGAK